MSGGLSEAMASASAYWRSRAPRERWMLGTGLVVLAVLLFYQLLWSPVDRWSAEQRQRRDRDVALAAYVAQAKVTLIHLRRAPAGTAPDRPKTDVLNQSAMQFAYTAAKARGIADRMDRREPAGTNGVRVQFSAVDFTALGRWIAAMNQAGFTLETAQIAPAEGKNAGPGRVEAKLEFEQASS